MKCHKKRFKDSFKQKSLFNLKNHSDAVRVMSFHVSFLQLSIRQRTFESRMPAAARYYPIVLVLD